jgi:hypothetical protein
MIRPAYITLTWSATVATTPRSWVMKITESPRSACRRFSSSRIRSWIVTSSAVVGSSQISTSGLQDSAMAMFTRWHMPPESWWGYCLNRRSGSSMPTSPSSSTARARASRRPSPKCSWIPSITCLPTDIVGSRQVRASWNTIAMRRPQISRRIADSGIAAMSFVVTVPSSLRCENSMLPAVIRWLRAIRPRIARAVTDLPLPDSPTIATTSPSCRSKPSPRIASTLPPSLSNEIARSRTDRRTLPRAGPAVS